MLAVLPNPAPRSGVSESSEGSEAAAWALRTYLRTVSAVGPSICATAHIATDSQGIHTLADAFEHHPHRTLPQVGPIT